MSAQAMTAVEVDEALARVKGASAPGVEDGTRVHVWYKAFGQPTARASVEAQRAEELGLPRDRYTGRVSRVWQAGGDRLVTMLVELERDRKYRTLNLSRGELRKFVVLGT